MSPGAQLGHPAFWTLPDEERAAAFRVLREQRPVSFQAELQADGSSDGPGFWAFTRYSDVLKAGRDPETFVSGEGWMIRDTPPELARFIGSLVAYDPPRHTELRSVMSRSFTPRAMTRLEPLIERAAAEAVDRIPSDGSFDLATDVAPHLPFVVICELVGIPESSRARALELTRIMTGHVRPSSARSSGLVAAAREMADMAAEIAAQRRAAPRGDLESLLVQADMGGYRLSSEEIGSYFVLLTGAGSETTSTAAVHGVRALTRFPAQRQLLLSDLDRYLPAAVEEILRWSSPVIQFRRTATCDLEVGGEKIVRGEKVVLFFASANRDESQFPLPDVFDITRAPNDHIAFGSGGPHYCLGAHLARRELTAFFRELLTRHPDIEAVEEPELVGSNFVHAVRRLRCRV